MTRRKVAKYGGKNLPHEKGEKNTTIYDLSQQIYSTQGKKETTLLEADVDTVSVIEDGRSSLEPLQLQRGIDGRSNSWLITFAAKGKTAETVGDQKRNQPASLMERLLETHFFFLSCKIKDIFQNKKGLFEREITVYSLKIFKGQSAL